jgi:hypothetical protein
MKEEDAAGVYGTLDTTAPLVVNMLLTKGIRELRISDPDDDRRKLHTFNHPV